MELAQHLSHKGKYYNIPEMAITPQPIQKPLPFYVASFSKTSVDIAAKRGLNIIYAPSPPREGGQAARPRDVQLFHLHRG